MIIYDLLYFFLILISFPFWIKILFKKEYRKIFKNRIAPNFTNSDEKSIWIHAVSVGEVRSLDLLLDKLKVFKKTVYFSVTTPSGYNYAKEKYQDIRVINAPLDLSFIVKRYIKKINPEILILNELEVWPNWIHLLKKHKVKILLINGRISKQAFKKYSLFKSILVPVFKKIDLFLIQSQFYKEKFLHLKIPADKIRVCGNIKADQAMDLKKKLLPPDEIFKIIKTKKPQKKIIIIASTHLKDENLVFPAIQELIREFSFIIVPRHPQRSFSLQEELNKINLKSALWSQKESIDIDREIMIYDKIGFLFNILSIADLVIMGGTFDEKIGGHNLYEPLALNKPIFGGPYYNNFPDIGTELHQEGLYKVCHNSDQLIKEIQKFKKSDKLINTSNEIFSHRTGGVKWTIKEIKNILF